MWRCGALVVLAMLTSTCRGTPESTSARARLLDADNPIRPVPAAPLGLDITLTALPRPPTAKRVRLGRWLFFDTRLSRDGTISCATCHQPEHAFSQTTPVATGSNGENRQRVELPAAPLGCGHVRAMCPTLSDSS
jgi:cytochrome c peroxidase